MPLPLVILISIAGVWFALDTLFLKKKFIISRENCELLWQSAPIYWQTLIGWCIFLVVGICAFW